MISINNNLSSLNTAHALSSHYGRLQTSTQRLSSGLRINGAADDAAGLAIRELMRADIAALNQGIRNANDAISMLQTFDGALSVIDEKLIRMKELAEQAATGTYDSTQRLMINSEFQAMGAEIDRIARATDFNGVKLLCSKLITWYTEEEKFVVTDPGSVANLSFSETNKAAITENVKGGNLININHREETIHVSLTVTPKPITGNLKATPLTNNETKYDLRGTEFSAAFVTALGNITNPKIEYNGNAWSITDYPPDPNDPTKNIERGFTTPTFADNGTKLGAMSKDLTSMVNFSLVDKDGLVDLEHSDNSIDPNITKILIDIGNGTYSIENSKSVQIIDETDDYKASYIIDTQTVNVNLKKTGGEISLKLENELKKDNTIDFDINIVGEVKTVKVPHHDVDPDQKLKIHFGPMNDSAEDYYYINYANCTREGLGIDDLDITTQEKAQNALVDINEAMVKKDKARAYFGTMQNRLENTMTNLSIQSENLQNAESRISDTEIALEMMNFVRNQILTQSAVAMLAQANSLPQMVMALIH